MKQLARVFLMMDPEPTSFSPVIIKHPFTDSGIVTVRSGNEYRAADITADEAVRSQWREQMASLIENAETPRHIYMMLTKSYRFAFLKYAMPYFSQKDFSEYLANAWVMCESPNNDPNFTQKQMLGLFKKADPQVLMDEDEYKQFQALEDMNMRGSPIKSTARSKSCTLSAPANGAGTMPKGRIWPVTQRRTQRWRRKTGRSWECKTEALRWTPLWNA